MQKQWKRLPDGELAVMQALWDAGRPLLRAELDAAVGKANGWGPQVLVTMLARLEKKAFVTREKAGSIGKCGACEMLVDGKIRRICITKVAYFQYNDHIISCSTLGNHYIFRNYIFPFARNNGNPSLQ